MRQVTAFFLRWTDARSFSKPIVIAVIVSLCCLQAVAEPEATVIKTTDVPSKPTHTVVVGDTLWNVTFRLRPEGMPMAQAMDILYESNPEAFLEGDSTKLIEGSVVTFPDTLALIETPQTVVSKQNASLTIPTIDPVSREPAESDKLAIEESAQILNNRSEDSVEETYSLPETDGVNQEVAVEENTSIEQSTSTEQPSSSQIITEQTTPEASTLSENQLVTEDPIDFTRQSPEIAVESTISQPQAVQQQRVTEDTESALVTQIEQFLRQFNFHDFYQFVDKLKQLPPGIWFFLGAFIIAFIINRIRKKPVKKQLSDNQESQDQLSESVLEGPFAEGDDKDDVFAPVDASEQTAVDLADNLPGLEELKVQLSEDADLQKQLDKDFESIAFDEDTLEIDPLQIKLDMASLCIEMGDIESAQSILEEIISEADKQGKAKAREILDSIET